MPNQRAHQNQNRRRYRNQNRTRYQNRNRNFRNIQTKMKSNVMRYRYRTTNRADRVDFTGIGMRIATTPNRTDKMGLILPF